MRVLITLAALVVCAATLGAETPPSDPVRVYIFTQPTAGGFTDTQHEWRTTAVERAIARVRTHKAVQLVRSPDAAEVIVEVLRVTDQETDPTRYGVTARPYEKRVYATLTAGAYSAPITTADMRLSMAGRLVGDALTDWIKANHARVLATRIPTLP